MENQEEPIIQMVDDDSLSYRRGRPGHAYGEGEKYPSKPVPQPEPSGSDTKPPKDNYTFENNYSRPPKKSGSKYTPIGSQKNTKGINSL